MEARRIRMLAVGASAAWLALALPGAARADNWWNSVLGFIGWGPGKTAQDGIDYSARPALVVPPTMDLPPPQAPQAQPADWPHDPDAAFRRKAEADSRRPAPPTPAADATDSGAAAEQADASDQQGKKVAAKQDDKSLDWIGSRSAGLSGAGTSIFGGNGQPMSLPKFDITNISTWNPFAGSSDTKEVRTLKVGDEPQREYLTQPPPGYRSPVAVDTDTEPSESASDSGSSVSTAPTSEK